jgi:hypothetical protein
MRSLQSYSLVRNDTTAQTPNGALPNGRTPKTGLCDPTGRHLPETAGT